MKTTTKMILASGLLSAALIAPAMAQPGDWGQRSDWVVLGEQHFQGRYAHEVHFPPRRGRHIDRIGLRSDGPVQCAFVRITFGNGETRELETRYLSRMVSDHAYGIDLPGNVRNVTGVALGCRALGDRSVTIQVVARK